MIIFDTETTGLITNSVIPASRQPRIIQLVALQLSDMSPYNEIGIFDTGRMNPGVSIEAEATKVHGITDEMVKDCPRFASLYNDLAYFFHGEDRMIAHNCAFDRDMIYYELFRMGKQLNFPWPINHVCTVEQTEHIKGYRLSLTDLYIHLFGEKFSHAHDALADVRALARCYVECLNREIIKNNI